jgi:23S rRNA pseudouridine1911/1915/1917 synthase
VSLLTGVSRAAATELVAAGSVVVNGRPATARSHKLVAGDVVEVAWTPPGEAAPLAPDPSVDVVVVHEDDEVVVVDKAPGVVVHPGAGNATGTLVQGLLARYPELAGVGEAGRPGIVHRIDRETSGLLVVARTPRAYDSLVAQLAARTVGRRYEALAWGAFEHPAGSIDGPIGRSRRQPTRMTVSAEGKEARTDYRVLHTFHEPVVVSHLELSLHTGRTHQIRVHLRSIGHPVVGDDQYGGIRQSLPVPRLWLHAEHLAFDHPVTGERIKRSSPLPPDLAGVLDRLA